MLILRNIFITLLLLALAAISVVGLMVEFPAVLHWQPTRLHELGRSFITVMRPGMLLFLMWIVLLLGTLLVFFITVARPRGRMKIEVQMGGGRVVIMDHAIKRYIRNALAEIGEVTVKKIILREHRSQVTTDIYADVRTRENLPTLERRIISRVRGALAEDLGITNLGDVHVFIKNFEVTGRPVRPAEESPSRNSLADELTTPAAQTAPSSPLSSDIGSSGNEFDAAGTAPLPRDPVIGGEPASDATDDPAGYRTHSAPVLPGDAAVITTDSPGTDIVAEKPLSGPATDVAAAESDVASSPLPPLGDAAAGVPPPDTSHASASADDLDEPLPWGLASSAGAEASPANDDDSDSEPRTV